MLTPLPPPLLINRGRPFVSKVDDHLEPAFPVMVVQVVDAARDWVDAVGQIVRFPRVSHLAQVLEERRDYDRLVRDVGC